MPDTMPFNLRNLFPLRQVCSISANECQERPWAAYGAGETLETGALPTNLEVRALLLFRCQWRRLLGAGGDRCWPVAG